jgi:Mn-dependent DtxR family transcriptional regulator
MTTAFIEVAQDKVTELASEVSLEKIKKAVLDYVDSHQGVKTSDILFELDFNPELVVEALEALEEEDLLEGRPIATK